ncbi:hypothetical protein [Pseudomaricurvus sp. HS19]|uniref:3'-5' exonuclease n=1 Tax=Pseudomaricurvus sp. HS19 TaxID=2692626 RepID=UPI0019289F6E|nr:hypothetical protein [Pseudomaricurvus sp. HS19]
MGMQAINQVGSQLPPDIRVPVVIDVEASGFHPQSYPIEVGVALETGERFSRLILPYPEWDHWSAEAELVHGISREKLQRFGRPGDQVAKELNSWLVGKSVYSDGWVLDKPWLIRLFEYAGVKMDFWFSPLEMILSRELMDHWRRAEALVDRRLQSKRHRASTDALRIQLIYIEAQLLLKNQ